MGDFCWEAKCAAYFFFEAETLNIGQHCRRRLAASRRGNDFDKSSINPRESAPLSRELFEETLRWPVIKDLAIHPFETFASARNRPFPPLISPTHRTPLIVSNVI